MPFNFRLPNHRYARRVAPGMRVPREPGPADGQVQAARPVWMAQEARTGALLQAFLSPRPQIIRMHVQRRRCGRDWHVCSAVFRDKIDLASIRLPGHRFRIPFGCAKYKSHKCASQASRHCSRRLPISCAKARRSTPLRGGSTRARSG